MNKSDLLKKLENIAYGLGRSTDTSPDGDFFFGYIYNDDKIYIQAHAYKRYHVKIKSVSLVMEEVFYHIGENTLTYRVGKWLNYIDSLQHKAIEGVRIRREQHIASLVTDEASPFSPIDDTDIFGS